MCHVLIIEDEWIIAEHLSIMVQEAGATSIAVTVTQDDAIASAREHHPRVILSDVKLLEGTGPQAVQAIYREQGEVPVIFITGTPEACQPCNPPGVVLTKPISQIEVAKAFRRCAALE